MRPSLLLLLASFFLSAAPGRAEDDPERGGDIYTTCVACHGQNAEGNIALRAPRLNHLAPVYVVAQLQKFRDGLRGADNDSDSARQMAAIAATLEDDQALFDTAAYIATLESAPPPATVEGDSEQGRGYYRQFCAACHGPAAQGNLALNSPRLAGTNDWYLQSQLHAFREGVRGSHPDDRTGRQMRAMAGVLPDEQAVAAVVAYIRSLQP
jgi:cytochrome c553